MCSIGCQIYNSGAQEKDGCFTGIEQAFAVSIKEEKKNRRKEKGKKKRIEKGKHKLFLKLKLKKFVWTYVLLEHSAFQLRRWLHYKLALIYLAQRIYSDKGSPS